jgi:hypothetical protein
MVQLFAREEFVVSDTNQLFGYAKSGVWFSSFAR